MGGRPRKMGLFFSYVAKLGENEFELCHVVDPAGHKKEAWKVLVPGVLPPVPDANLATGAQVGFHGPTKKENAVGGHDPIS